MSQELSQSDVTYDISFPPQVKGGERAANIALRLTQHGHNISEKTGDSMLRSLAEQKSAIRSAELLQHVGMAANQPYELIPGLYCQVFKEDTGDVQPVLEFWADPKANVPLSPEARLGQIPLILQRHGGVPRPVVADISARIGLQFPEMDFDPD